MLSALPELRVTRARHDAGAMMLAAAPLMLPPCLLLFYDAASAPRLCAMPLMRAARAADTP